MTARTTDREAAALRAQAGAWLARLHGPRRTQEVEEGFRAWMGESEQHRRAFERMTDTWEKTARMRRRPMERTMGKGWLSVGRPTARLATAAVAVGILLAIAAVLMLRSGAVSTAVGEQRILTLEDGSRIYLNTATEVRVSYGKASRRVEMARGEALFEVAKHPDRPFVVAAGNREITALGTSFIVRREEREIAVTLVEGKVAVTPVETRHFDSAMTLRPGERVSFGRQAARVDRPPLEKLTAWQRGQVALDDVSLADAVTEMNRYSPARLAVTSTRGLSIRISGIFRAGDSENFAAAVARTYGLRAAKDSNGIVLEDPVADD